RLATTEAVSDDRCEVLIDGVGYRDRQRIRRIDIDNACVARHCAGPFKIEICLDFRGILSRVRAARHQNYLRIVLWQVVSAPKELNIDQVDGRLSDHNNGLAGSVVTGIIERVEVVDGCEVIRRQRVTPGGAGVKRHRGPWGRLHIKVVQAQDARYNRFDGRGNRGLDIVSKV